MAQPFEFTFGRDLFNAYQKEKQLKEDERQFNEKMAMEERQNSLLQAFRQKEFELRQNEYQTNLQNQQYDNFINTGKEYNISNADQFVPYQNATQIRPSNSLLGDPNNPYLKDKVLTPITKSTKENDYTLGPGQTRFNSKNEVVAAIPDKPTKDVVASISALNRQDKLEKQAQDKQSKLASLDEEAGNMLAVLKSGGVDETGKIEFKGSKYSAKMLNEIYSNKVETLITEAGIRPTINSLKLKARTDYPDFNNKSKTEQRNILKKYLDDNQQIPDDIKPILYKFAETYRD